MKIMKFIMSISIASSLFAATSFLIKPTNGENIVDVGVTTPIKSSDVIIYKDWVQMQPNLKQISALIEGKGRIENVYSCITDEIGTENCSYGLENCQGYVEYKRGESIPTKVHYVKPRERVSASKEDREDDTFYGDWLIKPNYGAINGSRIHYVVKTTFHNQIPPKELFKQGWQYNGKFAMKMFNYGSGYGHLDVYPNPDHIYVLINGGSDVPSTRNRNWEIGSNDGKYATILVTWDHIPDHISFTCDDYCFAGKPSSPVGFWKWGCYNKKYTYNSTKKDCELDYVWYKYVCNNDNTEKHVTWDKNNPNGSWIGPLINSGGDCNAEGLNSNNECQSPIPPEKNCLRKKYSCPSDPNQLCTQVPEDNAKNSDAVNQTNGYIYNNGNSEEHKETIINDLSCPAGSTFDANNSVCQSEPMYKCLDKGFTYNVQVGECIKIPQCNGFIDSDGNCIDKPEIKCPDSFTYNENTGKCEEQPECDLGSFDPISGKCEQSLTSTNCPKGFTFNSLRGRCEAPLYTTERKNCPAEFTYNPDIKKCVLAIANFSNWNSYGDGRWQVQDGGKYVIQKINGNPTYFLGQYDLGTSILLSGKFEVGNDGDDDWAGLVFGWKGTNDLYVFDWKKHDQGNARHGLRLMYLSKYNTNLWGHTSTSEMKLLASNFSYPGWQYNKEYKLAIKYTFGSITAYIDGKKVLEYKNPNLNIAHGKVGFFNNSQSKVSYKDFKLESDPFCDKGLLYDKAHDLCYNPNIAGVPNVQVDLEANVYWVKPICDAGSLNLDKQTCEINPNCSNGAKINSKTQMCELTPDFECDNGFLIQTNELGFENACKNINACPANSYKKDFDILNQSFCVGAKYAYCPNGEKYNDKLNKCISTPYCPDGFVLTTDNKCKKDYTWYSYSCPDGWEGPAKPGIDCQGHCGPNGCSCNSETPMANNCRKPLNTVFKSKKIETAPMIIHKITGSVDSLEFGTSKNYKGKNNNLFKINKIEGKDNQLCFYKLNGNKACITVDNCNFYGAIVNKTGIREIQVGDAKKNNLKTCPPGYKMNIDYTQCTKPFDIVSASTPGAKVWKQKSAPTIKKVFQVKEFSHSGTLSYGIQWGSHDLDLHALIYNANGHKLGEIWYGGKRVWNGYLDHDDIGGGDETIRINVADYKRHGAKYVDFYVYSYSGGSLSSYGAKCWYIDGYEKKRTFNLVGSGRGLVLMRFNLDNNTISNLDSHVQIPSQTYYYCPNGYKRPSGQADGTTTPGTCYANVYYATNKYANDVDLNQGLYLAKPICDKKCQEMSKLIRGHYQYELVAGSKYSVPNIAPDDKLECFIDSTYYDKNLKECVTNNNLNLSKWQIYGADAHWIFTDNNTRGEQTVNTSSPTLLLLPSELGDAVTLSGYIRADNSDDDWIGLVFGVNSDASHYYRFTWHATGGGNSNSGYDISEYKNGKLYTLASHIVSGGGLGYARHTNYQFKVEYKPGKIIGYVNNKIVVEYSNKELRISGKAGFYGYSEADVSYWGFKLETSPKCPSGFEYDSVNKACIQMDRLPEMKIISTCKMNGHVGWIDNEGGIVSAAPGNILTDNQLSAIKDYSMNTFELNTTKVNPSTILEFWNPYSPNNEYLGFIEFVNDVSNKDRKNQFAAKNKLPYALGEDGFTAIDVNHVNSKTYYVSADSIGDTMTDEECNAFALKYHLQRVKEPTSLDDIFLKILAGKRDKIQSFDPIVLKDTHNNEFKYCATGKLNVEGKCDIKPKCILVDMNANKGNIFNTSDKAVKITLSQSPVVYKCSPYKCVGGQCKTETCPDGYKGNILPDGVTLENGECTNNICDGNLPFVDVCGKPNGCPVGPEFKPATSNATTCYQYTCEDGGIFDPQTKMCKVLKCPLNTIPNKDGKTCRRVN